MNRLNIPCAIAIAGCLISACQMQEANAPIPSAQNQSSWLAFSQPANGAVLNIAPQHVTFNFKRPIRMNEVIVSGPDGNVSPTKVGSIGYITAYTVPIYATASGNYTVVWNGLAEDGSTGQGEIRFTVRQ